MFYNLYNYKEVKKMKKNSQNKMLWITEDLHGKLFILKRNLRLKTISQTIKVLFDNYSEKKDVK